MRPFTTSFTPVEAWTRHRVCVWTDTAPTRGRAAVLVSRTGERELRIGDRVFYWPTGGWLVVGWDQDQNK